MYYVCKKIIRRRIAPEIPESTFLDILRNTFYKGKIRVPATKTEPEVIVDGLHKPLVTEAIFDTAQEIMDGKRKKNPKLTKPVTPEFYLRKYLVCPHCGRAITGAFSTGGGGGKYPYYFCPTTGKHVRMSADTVNTAFVDYVRGLRPSEMIMKLYSEVLSSIFSEKLEFDGKIFRTDGLNKVFDLIYQQTNELRGLNKKSEESFSTFPASVPRAGVEPAQG